MILEQQGQESPGVPEVLRIRARIEGPLDEDKWTP
jgi:hypothetical protein